jgi:hypothetical protein
MITGFRCYKYYISIKLHFTKDNYNVFETRGNVKGSEEAFISRNDRYIFERIARKYDTDQKVIKYFVSNFSYGNDAVVYNENDAEDNLLEWNRRRESLTRVFENDTQEVLLQKEKNNLDRKQIFEFNGNNLPLLFRMYLGKKVTIESMFLFSKLNGYLKRWHNNSSMILWEDDRRRIEKCDGFVKFDIEKLSPIYASFMEELG